MTTLSIYRFVPLAIFSEHVCCYTNCFSDCYKTVQSTLNLLESSLTTLDSAFNAPSVKKPLDLSNSSNITSSVYNICITSIGRTYCERLSECFSSVSFVSSFWTSIWVGFRLYYYSQIKMNIIEHVQIDSTFNTCVAIMCYV